MATRTEALKRRTVRLSVDLSVSDHWFLKCFAYEEHAAQADVGRALVALLRADDELAASVRAILAAALPPTDLR
jgi:hypothetical protein